MLNSPYDPLFVHVSPILVFPAGEFRFVCRETMTTWLYFIWIWIIIIEQLGICTHRHAPLSSLRDSQSNPHVCQPVASWLLWGGFGGHLSDREGFFVSRTKRHVRAMLLRAEILKKKETIKNYKRGVWKNRWHMKPIIGSTNGMSNYRPMYCHL